MVELRSLTVEVGILVELVVVVVLDSCTQSQHSEVQYTAIALGFKVHCPPFTQDAQSLPGNLGIPAHLLSAVTFRQKEGNQQGVSQS